MSSSPSEPLRILIVRIGAMGDVLHAMPAVAGLRASLPECVIGWAVEPRWLALLKNPQGGMPLVDRVHLVPTKDWKRRPLSVETYLGIAGLRHALRTEGYDLCVDLQGSMKSALISSMSGAKAVVGASHPREKPAKLFYDIRVAIDAKHVIDQACQLISAAVGRRIAPVPVELPVDPDAERWCESVLQAISLQGKSWVLVSPTAGWGAKEWGAQRYGQLAQQMMVSGFRVIVNKTTGALPGAAEQIAAAFAVEIVESTLPQLIALTRRAALVVGGDTGPVHLAAALGRPVVALFGPTDPRRNGPYFPGGAVEVLRNSASLTSHKRLGETEQGLAAIKVEEVVEACLRMLARA